MYISIVKMTIITAKWTNQTLWQAAHGDLERGQCRASRSHHLFAPTGRSAPRRPLCYWVRDVKILPGTGPKDKCVSFNESARKERRGSGASVCVVVCVRSLQEVNATPVRFISDMLVEDSWSHVFMDTLAPRGFVKVRGDRRREKGKQHCVDWSHTWVQWVYVDLNNWHE